MSDPKLSILVDVDTDPARKALKDVDTALDNTAKSAKAAGNKIDEAFKAAGGKVQEAIGPLGKLLGPTAIGVGAIGLAVGALGAAASKAFSYVKETADEVQKLGAASGLSATSINLLTTRAKESETAFSQLRAITGLWVSDLTSKLTPAIEWTTKALQGLRGEQPQSLAAGNATEDAAIAKGLADNKRAPTLSIQQDFLRLYGMRLRGSGSGSPRERIEFSESDLLDYNKSLIPDSEQDALMRYALQIAKANRADRVTAEIGPARDVTPKEGFLLDNVDLSPFAGQFGSGLGSIASAAIQNDGRGVLKSGAGMVSGLISTGLGPLLGPVAGSLVGGVLDGLIGAVFAEDEGSKLRREAMERTRERWRNTQRDRAWQRRQNLPELAAFSGPSAGATIVNVSFNAPVSSRRAARELADVLRGGG